jgi:hypothetical protein
MVPIAAEEDVGACYCKVTRINNRMLLTEFESIVDGEDLVELEDLERVTLYTCVCSYLLLKERIQELYTFRNKIYKIIDLSVS